MFKLAVSRGLGGVVCAAAFAMAPLAAAHAVPALDVIFMIDASGSVGTVGFADEKNFVENIIQNVLPSNSNAGAFTFSTNYTVLSSLISMSGGGAATLSSKVAAATYPAQYTYINNAVTEAINLFSTASVSDTRLLFYVTDNGEADPSTQSACSLAPTLASDNIQVSLIEGNPISGDPSSCLVNSPADDLHASFATLNTLVPGVQSIINTALTNAPEPSALSLLCVGVLGVLGLTGLRARRVRDPAP